MTANQSPNISPSSIKPTPTSRYWLTVGSVGVFLVDAALFLAAVLFVLLFLVVLVFFFAPDLLPDVVFFAVAISILYPYTQTLMKTLTKLFL